MMNGYGYMMGGGSGLVFYAWIINLLILTLIVLGIVALWKYINKDKK